jgi:nitrogen regulatory protein PII
VKLVEAIVKSFKSQEVKDALAKAGFKERRLKKLKVLTEQQPKGEIYG